MFDIMIINLIKRYLNEFAEITESTLRLFRNEMSFNTSKHYL